LPIPVFRNSLFGDQKQKKKQDSGGFLFFCVFRRNFSQERGFGEVPGIPVFGRPQDFFAGIPVGQEFLYLVQLPPDSCRIP
jgi:hypothetical protein